MSEDKKCASFPGLICVCLVLVLDNGPLGLLREIKLGDRKLRDHVGVRDHGPQRL